MVIINKLGVADERSWP